MSQYLDRKQVIELYEKYQPCMATRVYDFGEALRKLPVVEERPHGEWKRCLDNSKHWVWKCKCGWTERIATNFCPDCGADMRKKEGEKNEID